MTSATTVSELLPGTLLFALRTHKDDRGVFVKTHLASELKKMGLAFNFREEYFSISKKNVLRGMHFQIPPYHCTKLVYCPVGAVMDVLVDLRAGANFGKTASVHISGTEPSLLLVPPGVAHGFLSLEDNSVMVYKTDVEYAPSHDSGIHWASINFRWGIDEPIISGRDELHVCLENFDTPFCGL